MTAVYLPGPDHRAREQVAQYEATGGREGGTLDGKPVIILTTTGAKTGGIRKNPIMRIKVGDVYVAVASNGGATTNPSWFHNLVAHPELLLQDGTTVGRYRAREVHAAEKTCWWEVADHAWPRFSDFRMRAGTREIPVLLLEPAQ